MLKTAECVSPKHPDKMCDRISDAILDWYLKQDPESRVAVETMGGHGRVYIIGEVTSKATPIYKSAVEGIVREITGEENEVEFNIDTQSREIAKGVDTGGAGDQGIMVGYACNENEELIPQELYIARKLCKFIYRNYGYDGKTQITLDGDENIETVVASFCKVSADKLSNLVTTFLQEKFPSQFNNKHITIHANPAGDWNTGGFYADTGLTGRKLAVDNYGTRVPIGGGAFSGKDSTKVDRSGAYIARKIATEVLKEMHAGEVEVKIAYSIGVADPVMVAVNIDNGEDGYPEYILKEIIERHDLTPQGIIKELELTKPIFEETAEWGHFGNGFKWDRE
jgi:S-adenosylmethionine synthetase